MTDFIIDDEPVQPGWKPPVPKSTEIPRGVLLRLESQMRTAIFTRSTANMTEERVLRAAFKQIDLDDSGTICMSEFLSAMERFGLHVQGSGMKGPGGVTLEVAKALFERFDEDGSGEIDLPEFQARLLNPGKGGMVL